VQGAAYIAAARVEALIQKQRASPRYQPASSRSQFNVDEEMRRLRAALEVVASSQVCLQERLESDSLWRSNLQPLTLTLQRFGVQGNPQTLSRVAETLARERSDTAGETADREQQLAMAVYEAEGRVKALKVRGAPSPCTVAPQRAGLHQGGRDPGARSKERRSLGSWLLNSLIYLTYLSGALDRHHRLLRRCGVSVARVSASPLTA
jgi:hypothetical protein